MVSAVAERFANIIHHRVRVSATKIGDSAMELDSHADSPVVGEDAFILERTGRKV